MVAIPNPPSPTVDAIFKAREDVHKRAPPYRSWGISASSLGHECDRKLMCDLRWVSSPEEITGRKLRIFERGNIEEERVLDDLRRAGVEVFDVDPETKKQWRFSLANGWIRGKADGRVLGLLEAPKTEHLIEIKSMKASDWRAVKKHGLFDKKQDHWNQLHIGMAALGLKRGAYIAVNKDTEEILIERIELNDDLAQKQIERVLRLIESYTLPPRIADKADAFACRFCPHKGVCHERDWPVRSCRTCCHFTFTRDANGHCERYNRPLTPKWQMRGDECPSHVFLPTLVPGELLEVDDQNGTITYRLGNGEEWTDGDRPKPETRDAAA